MIDTAPLVSIERSSRQHGVFDFTRLGPGPGYVSAITLSELWVGYHRGVTVAQRERAEFLINFAAERLVVLSFDADAAHIRARLFLELGRRGITVGERDLQIAATAMAHGHSVLTGNVTEFGRIPGLTVIPWPGPGSR